jgi:hypothetical protein
MNRIVAMETAIVRAHLDTVLETDAGRLPLLHAMEERAGERRSLALEPEDAGLPLVDLLKCPSPRSFVAGRGSLTVSE